MSTAFMAIDVNTEGIRGDNGVKYWCVKSNRLQIYFKNMLQNI
jgi:hypothetical protein